MHSNRVTAIAAITIGLNFAIAAMGSSARADEKESDVITVTQQDRSINAWVWIGGCPQEVQNINASDTGPFDASVGVEPKCAMGEGAASSWQISEILDNGFEASGAGHLLIGAPQYQVIHGSARSRFDVTFQLNVARRYSLGGSIEAARIGDNQTGGVVVYTNVVLHSGNTQLFAQSVQPPANTPQQAMVEATGFLQPGSYRISMTANAFADQAFNNNWVESDVAFNITMVLTKAGDINRDGTVNMNDLLAVLNAWGLCADPCPPTCYGDADSDCTVNANDLLHVINDWG